MENMRLNAYIAKCGISSRRKADELIQQGKVFVNGECVTDMGVKITDNDEVFVNGEKVHLPNKKVYILLNKPVGVISSSKDQFGRKTVMDLIGEIGCTLHTVGRLDYDTSGLIILTNDGEFTYRLTHPKHCIEKTYEARINGILSRVEIKRFKTGLNIEDYITAPANIEVLEKDDKISKVRVQIHEGKNRQIRKMFEVLGYKVVALKRVNIGNIGIGHLKEGKWRYLNENEIKSLL